MTDHTPGQNPLTTRKPIAIALSLVTAFGVGIGTGIASHLPPNSNSPNNSISSHQSQTHTLEEYDLLEIGDSLRTVEQILGKGLEQKQTNNEVELIWENPDGSYIRLAFKDSVLAQKEQSQLGRHQCS